jgi:hypothetical protein
MRSLSKYIHEYFDVEYGSTEFMHIYGCSLKYLTRAITAGDLHKRLKRVSVKSIKVYRMQLVNEGYYLLNVKMWIIHAYANKRNNKWDPQTELETMGIMKRDRMYLPLFTKDVELRDQVQAITFQLGGRSEIPTISALKELLVKVMLLAEVKLKPLINNLLWTKLKFLIQCGSVDFESVKCELKAKMIQTFYWLAPYKKADINHWVMSMIKPVKNFAINLIKFYTTQKRTRMILEDGVYRVLEVSISMISDENSDNENLISDNRQTQISVEKQILAEQLIKRYGITQKRSKAFRLLSGVYDIGFTSWLRRKKHISANSNFDNTDFQEQTDNTIFLRLVAKFVGLKWAYFRKLILRIRKNFRNEGAQRTSDNYTDKGGTPKYASAYGLQ